MAYRNRRRTSRKSRKGSYSRPRRRTAGRSRRPQRRSTPQVLKIVVEQSGGGDTTPVMIGGKHPVLPSQVKGQKSRF